jgi:hypothetical protein
MRTTLLAVALAGLLASEQGPAVDLAISDLDRAQREIVSLNEQLRIARAQRAECETTLGPLEVAARAEENQRALEELKKAIEARHPGTVYDVRTGTLSKKPESPQPTAKQ